MTPLRDRLPRTLGLLVLAGGSAFLATRWLVPRPAASGVLAPVPAAVDGGPPRPQSDRLLEPPRRAAASARAEGSDQREEPEGVYEPPSRRRIRGPVPPDPHALLASITEGSKPQLALVEDARAFDALFARATAERAVHAALAADGAELEEGTTLVFPAGVYALPELSRVPRDVTIEGAGRDLTLLVGELRTRSALRNLTVRDCTWHVPDRHQGHFQLEEVASLSLERTRMTGFDTGIGANVLTVRALAVRATSSIFAGGYGQAPLSGDLFNTRSPAVLARFEHCTFERMALELDGVPAGATVVFHGCDMRDLFDDPEAHAAANAGIVLVGCAVRTAPEARHQDEYARDLNQLFPGWKAELARTGR